MKEKNDLNDINQVNWTDLEKNHFLIDKYNRHIKYVTYNPSLIVHCNITKYIFSLFNYSIWEIV